MEIIELEFENYKPEELVGMHVIRCYSNMVGKEKKILNSIKSATKTQFKLEGSLVSYNIKTGYKKSSQIFTQLDYCKLISDYSAIKIREANNLIREQKDLTKKISDKLNKYDLSIEKLESILLEITKS